MIRRDTRELCIYTGIYIYINRRGRRCTDMCDMCTVQDLSLRGYSLHNTILLPSIYTRVHV